MSDNIFHAHLNDCLQCRNNPMQLCAEGLRAIRTQVEKKDPGPQATHTPKGDPAFNPMQSLEDSFQAVFGVPLR